MSRLTKNEIITKESYERTAKAWTADHWTVKFWGDNFDTFYSLLPGGRVLEIGCGAGRDAQELVRHGYDYLGTDISRGQVKEAQKNNTGAKFEVKSIYDLSYDQPFDGFWCAAVLIHIPRGRIDEALTTIRNNMANQAIGFIAIKEGQGEKVESRPEYGDAKFLYTYYENNEFKSVLTTNGFEVIKEGQMPFSQRSKWLTYHVKTS